MVAFFGSFASAGRFAAWSARRLGRSVAVRRAVGLGWSVPVPCSLRSSRWPCGAGRVVFWSGGLRGFVRALGSAGLVRGVGG